MSDASNSSKQQVSAVEALKVLVEEIDATGVFLDRPADAVKFIAQCVSSALTKLIQREAAQVETTAPKPCCMQFDTCRERCIPLVDALRQRIASLTGETSGEHHGLDNARQVFFYEQDFYVLSNFSAFCVHWRGKPFFTSEHAYHWARFELPAGKGVLLQDCVQRAASAHEAFKFAQAEKSKQRTDWDAIKVDTMREILREKAAQHEYVARKLDATGDRELIENSWRDDFWGWGPNRDGQNMLGKLWMEIRAERRLRVKSNCNSSASTDDGAPPSRTHPTSSVECPKCRTQLAFEGDECGLCKEAT